MKRQRGLALITAMLIVAIVASVATALALGQQIWLQQTANIVDRARADGLRHGAWRFAAIALAKDAKDNKTDDLTEDWAKPLPILPVDGGAIAISVVDAQGRFNLNNLVRGDAPSAADIGVFKQLLLITGLDPELSDAVVDWLDSNSAAQPGGAEDVDYLNEATPYRAANQPFASVEELRLVKGFDEAALTKLRPYLTALPEPVTININTASSTVLAALVPDLSLAAAEQIVNARATAPFTESVQLTQQLPPEQRLPQAGTYDVRSSYFIVTVDVRVGRAQRRTEALLQRPAGRPMVNVLWQRQPPLEIEPDEDTEKA